MSTCPVLSPCVTIMAEVSIPMSQSPIFVKTYDMLLWLVPQTMKFRREHRFVLAKHVQETAFQFQTYLIEAASLPQQNRREKVARLNQADVELIKLRFQLRLCRDLELLAPKSHQHVSQQLDEIGRLLGGWFKSLAARPHREPIPDLPQ